MKTEKNYLEHGKSYAREVAARYSIRYGQLEESYEQGKGLLGVEKSS